MKRALGVALALIAAIPAFAQLDGRNRKFEEPLLDKLAGRWNVTGQVRGSSVKQLLTAGWVLDHQFFEMQLVDEAKPSQYEARIFLGYDFMSDRYVAHWLDVFGGRFSETLGYGSRAGDSAISIVYEYPDRPFRNTLTWNADIASWRWLIESKNDQGKWTTFADYLLRNAARMTAER
jgi:hypothetical protein